MNRYANTFSAGCYCSSCGRYHALLLPADRVGDYFSFRMGTQSASEAFPDLLPVEQRFLSESLCPECQESMYGAECVSERITRCPEWDMAEHLQSPV